MVKHFSDKYFSGNQIKFILILISSFIMIYGCKSPEPKKSERTEKSTPENFQVQAKKEANYSSNSSSTFLFFPMVEALEPQFIRISMGYLIL
jgi:hypothetical protein